MDAPQDKSVTPDDLVSSGVLRYIRVYDDIGPIGYRAELQLHPFDPSYSTTSDQPQRCVVCERLASHHLDTISKAAA